MAIAGRTVGGSSSDDPSPAEAASAADITDALAFAEKVASKDRNNLYIVSLFFQEAVRYRAFCAMYAVMRVVDDVIDDVPDRLDLSAEKKKELLHHIEKWRVATHEAWAGTGSRELDPEPGSNADLLLSALTEAFQTFPTPLILWDNFYDAMAEDVVRPRFATFQDFLEYAEGAAVSPTTIMFYLVSSKADEKGVYRVDPSFDYLACGRDMGRFAYLAHILRDLARDLEQGNEGLLYLSQEDLARHGVTEEQLFAALETRTMSEGLRDLIIDLDSRARTYLESGKKHAENMYPLLTSERLFMFKLTQTIYEEILENLKRVDLNPFVGKHHLASMDKLKIAQAVADEVGLSRELVTRTFLGGGPLSKR